MKSVVVSNFRNPSSYRDGLRFPSFSPGSNSSVQQAWFPLDATSTVDYLSRWQQDGILANGTSEDATVPVHIVTHASQLPSEFLNPSADSQLVVGFDCEGIDLCRAGGLCLMQVNYPSVFKFNSLQGIWL
ncbi:hypothetical protein IEQ34_011104 [Dendrobium chrysotoxum]|uniref:Uncharacterized protein n=1 Tax=Dendrobium chrysotoxum TaxID=161865 RepID=A0AAV7GUL4_DENCH|nr:hypothetical protein IEQ34_011104 [Dendrobium chrysotoxum]